MFRILLPLLAFVSAAIVANAEELRPRIGIQNARYDFGPIQQGQALQHSFVITNPGSSTLRIVAVIPGCSCTTSTNGSKEIGPGKAGTVTLTFDTIHEIGPTEKHTLLICNDPQQPTNVLTLAANVIVPILVEPTSVTINVATNVPTHLASLVEIINNQEWPIRLSEPHSDNPYFAAELREVHPGRYFELYVRTVPECPATNLHGHIQVKTDSQETPEISVDVKATLSVAEH